MNTLPNVRTVSSLIGSRQLAMAVTCLGSLLEMCQEPIRLRLHDDGTLTDSDLDVLARELRGPEVVRRREADARLGDFLAGRSATSRFRRRDVFFLKLTDVVAYEPADDVVYCDSDVFFFRPFRSLLPRDRPDGSALLMADYRSAYCLRFWDPLFHPEARIPPRLNAGLVAFPTCRFDLDLVEWLAGRSEGRHWVEQTCWAVLASRAGCRVFDPRQIALVTPRYLPRPEELVAGHFVTSGRHLLGSFGPGHQRGETVVELRSVEPESWSIVSLALGQASWTADRVERRLRRLTRPSGG